MDSLITGKAMAEAMRRMADAIEDLDQFPRLKSEQGPISEEHQVGAAVIVAYLRDLFTATPKEHFTRDEILIVLNEIQNDPNIFTLDLLELFG
jgi:hypothetical protein